jgi:hypothetical protein
MIKLRMTAIEDGGVVWAEGESFTLAAMAFIAEVQLVHGDYLPWFLWEGIAELGKAFQEVGDVNGLYQHRDFSNPEGNFDLSLEVVE